MLLITIFVELRVVTGRSRTLVGSPQTVCRRLCCAVALRITAWSEQGMGAAWARHAMYESALSTGLIPASTQSTRPSIKQTILVQVCKGRSELVRAPVGKKKLFQPPRPQQRKYHSITAHGLSKVPAGWVGEMYCSVPDQRVLGPVSRR